MATPLEARSFEAEFFSQFAAIAPKVREFFDKRAFGQMVDLESKAVVSAMSTTIAHYVTVKTFADALRALTIEDQQPVLLDPDRALSATQPFPWSRPVWKGRKCVFNLVPCDNAFERAFAKFLDLAEDVASFSKLPELFGFAIEYTDSNMNLRHYYPDFVAIDRNSLAFGNQRARDSRRTPQGSGGSPMVREREAPDWRELAIQEGATEGLRAAGAEAPRGPRGSLREKLIRHRR